MTLFNRGRSNPHLFPQLEKLRGDRNGKLEALAGRKWDAVIDTSAYVPRIARLSAKLLENAVRQYLFVSTISVYARTKAKTVREDAKLARIADPSSEKVTGASYGALKALCEQEVTKVFGERATQVRPGLIVGPGDRSDRFTYWPVRVGRGGRVLAPGASEASVQFIDARDLAAWMIQLLEEGHAGSYQAVGFDGRLSMAELLHGCKCCLRTDVDFEWLDEDFLRAQKLRPWMDLPLWIPQKSQRHYPATKAIAAGLRFRPIAETIRDTYDWAAQRAAKHIWRAGIKAEREAQVLAAFDARQR